VQRCQFTLGAIFWLTAIATVCSVQWSGGEGTYVQQVMRAAAAGFLASAIPLKTLIE
jgi:hypothetical protein